MFERRKERGYHTHHWTLESLCRFSKVVAAAFKLMHVVLPAPRRKYSPFQRADTTAH